jgi:hypothetical protein
VSERAGEPMSQRLCAEWNPLGPAERSEGVHVSERASEPMSQRLCAEWNPLGPAERSEGVR